MAFKNVVTAAGDSVEPEIPYANRVITFATWGSSIANTSDTQVMVVDGAPANNDVSVVTAPTPTTNLANIAAPAYDKFCVGFFYPQARIVTSCGIGGRTQATMITDETAASTTTTRKAFDCNNLSPDVVLHCGGGINDLLAASFTNQLILESTYQTLLANHKTSLAYLLASCSGMVYDFGIYGYSSTNANQIGIRRALMRLNADVDAYVQSLGNPRLEFIDLTGIVRHKDGNFIHGGDGVHLSSLGAMARDKELAKRIEKRFGKSKDYTHAGVNRQINPTFTDTQVLLNGLYPNNYTTPTATNATLDNARIVADDNGKRWALFDVKAIAAGAVLVTIPFPYNPKSTGTNPLNVTLNQVIGFEADLLCRPVNKPYIFGLSQAEIQITTYGVSNAGVTRVINNPRFNATAPSATALWEGEFVCHVATQPQRFQDVAANFGTLSGGNLRIGYTAEAAFDVNTVGFAMPRIV